MIFSYNLLSSLLFAFVQGMTEWFPISSSGHLVLAERLLGYHADFLFDVALHFGTLMAVFVYFGGDIVDIVREVLLGHFKSENGRLGLLILLGSVPAAIIGFLFLDIVEETFSSLTIVVIGFGVTGLLLFIASIYSPKKKKTLLGIGYYEILLIGCAQAFALLPGISRSGSTIAVGLLLGLKEKDSAKYSFLLSIPAVFGANLVTIGNSQLPPNLLWATLLSFVVGLITIYLLFRFVFTDKKNLKWFAIYLLILAAVLGILLLFGFI